MYGVPAGYGNMDPVGYGGSMLGDYGDYGAYGMDSVWLSVSCSMWLCYIAKTLY